MAGHLAAKLPEETCICVFDTVESLIDQLCEKHSSKVTRCAIAKEVALKSSVVFTMLPEGQHVKPVYLVGPDSICASDVSNETLVDCSTIDTQLAVYS